LGAVGYFLLAGRFVFEGTNAIEICAQHLSAVPEPPSSSGGLSLDPELERIIMECLEKKVDDRPASGLEVADRLRALPIEPWTQEQAADWWDTVGEEIQLHRQLDEEFGGLGTIQAAPVFTDQ
jgi:serine/threonine-protein kinase